MSLVQFEEYLILEGHREYTIECHLRRLKQLLANCTPFNEEKVKQFLILKKKAGVKGASLNRLIITLRKYSRCAGLEWGLHFHLFKEEEPNKGVFSDEEIESIISLERLPGCRPEVWKRWTVWLQVLAFSGMRPNEVSTLTVDQIDWGTNNFVLAVTKTRPRRVPIAAILKPILKEYLKDKEHYLFPVSSKRGHVWRQGWQKHMDLRMRAVGIKRANLTTNSFRHSFISNLWEERAPLPDIMSIVGHKKPETTLRYSHLGNRSAQKSINQHTIVKKYAEPDEQLEDLIEEAKRRGMLTNEHFEWSISNHSLHIEIKKER